MKAAAGSGMAIGTDRPLTVGLVPTHLTAKRRRRAVLSKPGVLPAVRVALAVLFSVFLCLGSAPLALLLGLLLVASSGVLLLQSDYRWALRIERGRLHLLRNGVTVLDASVLPEGGQHLLIEEGRLEALRCRPGEPPSYVFGVPQLQLLGADLQRVQERLQAERMALESTSRQLELLDDPDVQTHLLGRLQAEERGRPGALRAALLSLSQGASARARAAQALLSRGDVPPALPRPHKLGQD